MEPSYIAGIKILFYITICLCCLLDWLPILQFFNKRFFSVEEILPLLPSSNNEQFPQTVI